MQNIPVEVVRDNKKKKNTIRFNIWASHPDLIAIALDFSVASTI
jgi:hypothetical protein